MKGFANYPQKRLCDIVFPGTHDAGIYGNHLGATAKTQNRNIFEQAEDGVRWFDLRIARVQTPTGLRDRAYHAPALQTKSGPQGDYNKLIAHKKFAVGAGGHGRDDLSDMLGQARTFVEQNADEFLVLRFSKCGNMESVVMSCIENLGDKRFDQNVHLNTVQAQHLAGKVVVVIDEPDFIGLSTKLKGDFPGILSCKSLFSSSEDTPHAKYDPNMFGVQYFGKYSNTRKNSKNLVKQSANLAQGPSSAPELLGMMYWTLTTNPSEAPMHLGDSIEDRDRKMWSKHQNEMVLTWESGVKDHIVARAGHRRRQWLQDGYPAAAAGRTAEAFMPNIIMMDFADSSRCNTVWNLNSLSANIVNQMGNDLTNIANIV